MTTAMAQELKPDDMRDIFLDFDKSGNGNIESKDIGEVMRALGRNPTNEEVIHQLYYSLFQSLAR